MLDWHGGGTCRRQLDTERNHCFQSATAEVLGASTNALAGMLAARTGDYMEMDRTNRNARARAEGWG